MVLSELHFKVGVYDNKENCQLKQSFIIFYWLSSDPLDNNLFKEYNAADIVDEKYIFFQGLDDLVQHQRMMSCLQ